MVLVVGSLGIIYSYFYKSMKKKTKRTIKAEHINKTLNFYTDTGTIVYNITEDSGNDYKWLVKNGFEYIFEVEQDAKAEDK